MVRCRCEALGWSGEASAHRVVGLGDPVGREEVWEELGQRQHELLVPTVMAVMVMAVMVAKW